MKHYKLTSGPTIGTPGLLAYLESIWRAGDHLAAIAAMAAGFPTIPVGLAAGLLDGQIEYRIEDGSVLIDWDEEPVQIKPQREPEEHKPERRVHRAGIGHVKFEPVRMKRFTLNNPLLKRMYDRMLPKYLAGGHAENDLLRVLWNGEVAGDSAMLKDYMEA